MKYRVIQDGEKFRAQRKGCLFWRDLEYVVMDAFDEGCPVRYSSRAEAEKVIEKPRIQESTHHRWQTI